MSATILGLGTARPSGRVSQSVAAELAGPLCCDDESQARRLQVLYRRSGVRQRASVLLDGTDGPVGWHAFYPPRASPEDAGPSTTLRMARYALEAPPLARLAAQRSLAAAGIEPAAIGHVVTVSCTGFMAPGLDLQLVRELGLQATTARSHIGFMGCHGLVNGLRVTRGLVASDPDLHVLVCAVELCTLHFQYGWDPEQLVANGLFGDGAAALVLGPSSGGRGGLIRLRATGSLHFPASDDAMTWRVGDHGFRMTLSPRVPDLIAGELRPWLDDWLGHQGLSRADVGAWAIHPGGPRILDAARTALELPPEATATSRAILAEGGNMSSPTVAFVLEALAREGAPRPWVALAFGPGLVAEAALLS